MNNDRTTSSLGDARQLTDGAQIPTKKALNKHLVTCDTLQAILDPDYFLKKIQMCEKARQEEVINLFSPFHMAS